MIKLKTGNFVQIKSEKDIKIWQKKAFGYVVYSDSFIDKIAKKIGRIVTMYDPAQQRMLTVKIKGEEVGVYIDDVQDVLQEK